MFFFSFENKNPWNRFLLCFFGVAVLAVSSARSDGEEKIR
jgi:hypothetical protein